MKESRIFKSKIDWALFIPMYILLGGLMILISLNRDWIVMIIMLLIPTFVTHLLLTTQYIISDDNLNIRSGFIINKNINIRDITRICQSNDFKSAPAASLDRLEIQYNQSDHILVSPIDKHEFVNHLRLINPGIDTELKTIK